MIAGFFCIGITPFLFTHFAIGIDFASSNSNNIGATIGGITTPFTGLLGSILIYFALKEQVKANTLIQEQLDSKKATDEESKVVTYLKQKFEMIKSDIENIQYIEKITKTAAGVKTDIVRVKIGSDAIYKYLAIYVAVNKNHSNTDIAEDIHQLIQLENLLVFIDEFVKLTFTEQISLKDKTLLLTNLKYLYIRNIKLHFDYLEQHKSSNLKKCDVCQLYHFGIPDKLFDITYSINRGLQLQ